MYKYEKVTDLNLNEIAIAMINGEVFYNASGTANFQWEDRQFINGRGNTFFLTGDFYRRIEPEWYEKLDGTKENGVLCWVSDENEDLGGFLSMVINYHKDESFQFEALEEHWVYATPLTKAEIQHLLDNAPE